MDKLPASQERQAAGAGPVRGPEGRRGAPLAAGDTHGTAISARARAHARAPHHQREHGAARAGRQRGAAGQHQQRRPRGRQPQAHARTSVEHNPALAGALPPEGAHVGAAADQPGEDAARVVPLAHAALRGRGRAQLHHVVGRRAGLQRAAAPLAAAAVLVRRRAGAAARRAPRARLRPGARPAGHRAPAGPRGCEHGAAGQEVGDDVRDVPVPIVAARARGRRRAGRRRPGHPDRPDRPGDPRTTD